MAEGGAQAEIIAGTVQGLITETEEFNPALNHMALRLNASHALIGAVFGPNSVRVSECKTVLDALDQVVAKLNTLIRDLKDDELTLRTLGK